MKQVSLQRVHFEINQEERHLPVAEKHTQSVKGQADDAHRSHWMLAEEQLDGLHGVNVCWNSSTCFAHARTNNLENVGDATLLGIDYLFLRNYLN